MDILVAAVGSPGHSYPLVPLALALRDAGHAVTFATGPDVADDVAAAGLDVVAVGGRLGDAFGSVMARFGLTERPTDPEAMRAVAVEGFGDELARAVFRDLHPRILERRPDLVVAEVGAPGAALAAGAAGVPCVLHSFGRRPSSVAPMAVRARGPVPGVAADLGIDLADGDPLGHTYLDVCPPSLQSAPEGDEVRELPLRPTAWNPPVPGFDPAGGFARPWAYLTLGTAWGEAGPLRAAVDALREHGLSVLLAAGAVAMDAVADLAATEVRVEPFVPQADLLAGRFADRGLPAPALVAHHGGSGTTLATAAAGIPQLVLPQGADQYFNAAAVSAVGAGRSLTGTVDAAAVGDAAAALLADGPERAAATALAAEIAAMPAPSDVAADVTTWAVAG